MASVSGGIATVQKGDTLAQIAAQEGLTLAELRAYNPTFRFDQPLMAGETLRVRASAPGGAAIPPAASTPPPATGLPAHPGAPLGAAGGLPPVLAAAPPPAYPTSNTGYSPAQLGDPNLQATLSLLQSRLTPDELSQVMQSFGGLGAADGSGVMGQQAATGSGQMVWPGSNGPTGTNPPAVPGTPNGGLEPPLPGNPPPTQPGGPPPVINRPGGPLPPGGGVRFPNSPTATSVGQAENTNVGFQSADAQMFQLQSAMANTGGSPLGSSAPIGGFTPTAVTAYQPSPSASGSPAVQSSAAPTTPTAQPVTGINATSTAGSGTATGQNAQVMLQQLLSQWGLGSLSQIAIGYLQQGYDAPSIQYLLEQTPDYQRRFAGNAARVKQGLPPLSPSQYIATEQAYQDALRSAGLPSGFYDSPDDFTSWISNDVSPAEVSSRAQDAQKFAMSTDPTYRTALQSYFGIDQSHIAAYFLDPTRAAPLLQKQVDAASIGAAALDQGLQLTNQTDAFRYVDQGVSEAQARSAYGNIASLLPNESAIAQRFGQTYTQTDAEQEMLGGLASAQRKRQQLNQQEQSLFAGQGGVGTSLYHEAFGLGQDVANF